MRSYRKNRGWRAWLGQDGFSLNELIIAVAIIGILGAIATPGILRSIPRYQLRGAARDLVSNFQKAKLEAVKRQSNVAIVFDLVANSYQIFIDDGGTTGTADNFVAETLDGEVMLAEVNLPQNISIYNTTGAFGGPDQLWTGFSPRGIPLYRWSGVVDIRIVGDDGMFLRLVISPAGSLRLITSLGGANGPWPL